MKTTSGRSHNEWMVQVYVFRSNTNRPTLENFIQLEKGNC